VIPSPSGCLYIGVSGASAGSRGSDTVSRLPSAQPSCLARLCKIVVVTGQPEYRNDRALPPSLEHAARAAVDNALYTVYSGPVKSPGLLARRDDERAGSRNRESPSSKAVEGQKVSRQGELEAARSLFGHSPAPKAASGQPGDSRRSSDQDRPWRRSR